MLSYEDVATAADWLCSAFGLKEIARFETGGKVTHVNLAVGDAMVMLGWPGPYYRSPKHHREACDDARRWLESPFVIDGIYMRVDDIDALTQRR